MPPGTVGVGAWLRVWPLDEDATSFVFVTWGAEAGDTGGCIQIEIVIVVAANVLELRRGPLKQGNSPRASKALRE